MNHQFKVWQKEGKNKRPDNTPGPYSLAMM
jgi:hypothetical protein